MKYQDNSLNVVVIGNWNKVYTDPIYLANTLFSGQEVTLEVTGQGLNFSVQCKYKDVCITPTTDRIQFTCTSISAESVEFFTKTLQQFFKSVESPAISGYGINIRYNDTEDDILPKVIDSISDREAMVEMGCEILSTNIVRKINYNGLVYNISFSYDNKGTVITFNQHNEVKGTNKDINISNDRVFSVIQQAKDILHKLGYETED